MFATQAKRLPDGAAVRCEAKGALNACSMVNPAFCAVAGREKISKAIAIAGIGDENARLARKNGRGKLTLRKRQLCHTGVDEKGSARHCKQSVAPGVQVLVVTWSAV